MKALSIPLLTAALVCPAFAEKAVPFDNIIFRVHVTSEPNARDSLERGSNVYVSAHLAKGDNAPKCTVNAFCGNLENSRYHGYLKKLAETEGKAHAARVKQQLLQHHNMGLHLMQISKDGIDALKLTAEESAKDGPLNQAASKRVKSDLGITVFKPLKLEKQPGVEISREGVQVHMTVEEALMMAKDYQEAVIAKAWYEKLLTAKNMPTPDDTARPPRGTITSMTIYFGDLEAGPFKYQAQAISIGENAIQHELDILEHNGAHRRLTGPWVREMMFKVAEANQAAQKLDGYSFIGRHGISRYEVTAQPAARTSELRIHPEFGHSRLFHHKADFDIQTAQQLASIITRADKVDEFLTENLELLVLEEEGDGKPLE